MVKTRPAVGYSADLVIPGPIAADSFLGVIQRQERAWHRDAKPALVGSAIAPVGLQVD